MKNAHRRVIVLFSLISVLTLTSALLLALAPAPLTADASSSLFAIDTPRTIDVIFQTETPATRGRWKHIYIHHSHTTGGNALSLAPSAGGVGDHFVIGNGDGCMDGEIQVSQRWARQLSAAPPPGASGIDPNCISICVVGDFERAVPTPTQLKRLGQLVGALQRRLGIGASDVILFESAGGPEGVGRYFPATALREQALP